MDRPQIDTLDAEQTLVVVESIYADTIASNADLFRLAAHFADLNAAESMTPAGDVLPGAERAVRLGGVGTPWVREFLCADFGARMQMGTTAAKHYISDALDVRHRLPLLWARVVAGEVKVGWARMVATRTHHLSLEAAAYVDAAVAESADGRISFGRFEALVDAKVVAADPETAARREAEAAARRFARASRASEDGMRMFSIRAGVGAIARIDATVSYLAAGLIALGDASSEDERRVKACLLMANPHQAVEMLAAYAAHRKQHPDQAAPEPPVDDDQLPPDDEEPSAKEQRPEGGAIDPRPFRPDRPPWKPPAPPDRDPDEPPVFSYDPAKLLPVVQLYLHLSQQTLEDPKGGVCRLEGHPPLSAQWVKDFLRPLHSFRITPVIDPLQQAPVDSYELPHAHREAVRLLTPADCFPFATRVGRPATTRESDMDADHTEPFVPGKTGQSRIGNYGPMTRLHHRIKTFGGFDVKQPFPGIFIWRDRVGRFFLVDHTGTRALPKQSDTG